MNSPSPAPAFALADQAESFLDSMYSRLREPTVKLAAFRTARGRQLGLARERKQDIFLWAECHDATIPGVHINNQKRPGQPYSPDQPRAASISTQCENLGIGKQAFYLKFDTLAALERFARWYDRA